MGPLLPAAGGEGALPPPACDPAPRPAAAGELRPGGSPGGGGGGGEALREDPPAEAPPDADDPGGGGCRGAARSSAACCGWGCCGCGAPRRKAAAASSSEVSVSDPLPDCGAARRRLPQLRLKTQVTAAQQQQGT